MAPGPQNIKPLQGVGRGLGGGGGSPGEDACATNPRALPHNLAATPTACIRCGACMAVCPLYGLLGREPAVARGKLNLLARYQEGELASGRLLREVLECCLLCGACSESCAVHLPVPELITEARNRLRLREGRKWSPTLLLAHLTWQAPHLIPAMAPLAPVINRLKSWLGAESGLVMRLWPNLALALQIFPNLSRTPFRATAPRWLPGRGSLKVAFFVGCGLEALFPQAGRAFLSICQELGVEVLIPAGQGCCGLMAESMGELPLARDLGRRLVQEFAPLGVDFLVTACASCAFQLKRLGHILKETPEAEGASQLAGKAREASEFLVQVAGYRPVHRRRPLEGVIFHDPCHLHRGQGIFREPRELLQAATGTEPLEPARRMCCGLGGPFGVLYPALSRKLGEARHQGFKEAGAQILATSCSGCLAQLKSTSPGLETAHLLELIAPIS
jgi:glycolate oxidase iron-sulfur subunit